MIKINNRISWFILALLVMFFVSLKTAAAESFIYIKEAENNAGDYMINSPDDSVMLKIFQDSKASKHVFKFMTLAPAADISQYFTYENGLQPGSDLFYLKFSNFNQGDFSVPPQVTVKYDAGSAIKGIYYYDWAKLQFQKIDATIDATNSLITFNLPDQPELVFALFRAPEMVGNASWYVHPRYRYDLIAASVDYPFDTKLRVINAENGKEVLVTVKDYGPDKSVHPDRVVDLSKVAFKALAPLSSGVIKVKVIKEE